MGESIKTYEAKFGSLTLQDGPENDFYWVGFVCSSNDLFLEKIPIYIFTKVQNIAKETIQFVERIILNINEYLEKSIAYIKRTLIEKSQEYKIQENEKEFLINEDVLPLDLPEFTFWENSNEWMIRFAEGKFSICDPLGIGITFKLTEPLSVDNLEDCDFID